MSTVKVQTGLGVAQFEKIANVESHEVDSDGMLTLEDDGGYTVAVFKDWLYFVSLPESVDS